jgi:hypothetical protein
MYRNANEGSAPEAPYIHRPIFPTFHRCSRREARHSANDGLHAVTSRITKRSLIGSCVAPSRSAQEKRAATERRISSKQRGYEAALEGATQHLGTSTARHRWPPEGREQEGTICPPYGKESEPQFGKTW